MYSNQKTARLSGLFWLLVAVTTGFSLGYVRSKLIVSSDVATTVSNIIAFESLFRAAIVSAILSQIFFLFFGLTTFRLFKGVSQTLTTIFMAAVVVAVAIGAVNTMNNFGALWVITNPDYLKVFQAEQVNLLAMTFLRLNNFGIGLLELFSAISLFSLALLIIRSGYLPRIIGVLLLIGACAFPINSFSKIMLPQFHPALMTQLTMLLNAVGPPAAILWLLIKGVREQTNKTWVK